MMRKPFQGVWNIVRFNRQFYIVALTILLFVLFIIPYLPGNLKVLSLVVSCLAASGIAISLAVSHYIYDYSDLYKMNWLPHSSPNKILNVHSGFDETSLIIQQKFPNAELKIADFYDAKKHTEVSIKRAREIYPPHPETASVKTDALPFNAKTFDVIIVCLAAHEIRNDKERITFFKELQRIAEPSAKIYITEHLRDFKNFMAYSIGFFHFHSRATWFKTFHQSGFQMIEEKKTTPFITTFILERNGNSL